jgi:cytochrome P450
VPFLGREDLYHVAGAKEVVDVLSRDGHGAVFEASDSFARLMADFTTENMTDGERRRSQRRAMAPGFSQDALREYVPVLDDIMRGAMREWGLRCADGGRGGGDGNSNNNGNSNGNNGTSQQQQQQQPKNTIEIQEELRLATIDVANGLLVGMRGLDARQKARLQGLMSEWFGGLTAPAVDLPGLPFRRALEARQALIDMLQPLVAEQRPAILAAAKEAGDVVAARQAQAEEEELAASSSSACPFAGSGLPGAPEASNNGKNPKKKNRSILAFTAAAHRELSGEDFTDLELTLQLMGLLLAGVDTSAGSFTLLVLALTQLGPEVWEKLRAEQVAVANEFAGGDLAAPLDKAMLDAMPYADAVAKEVQYLFPVAQVAMRTAKSDLAVAGVRVPQGATLLLNFAAAQAADALGGGDAARALEAAGSSTVDPPVLDSAWLRRHFKPERWLAAEGGGGGGSSSPSSSSSSSGPTLLAFSSGPHVCLGQQLYQLEARCLLARLARHYTLELEAEPADVAKSWRRFGAPGATERCLWMCVTPRGEDDGGDGAPASVAAR